MITQPHRRFNPLSGEWVLVSPHRTQRPWQGQVERQPQPTTLQYDPSCYLCPGNSRVGGAQNPHYESTFAFDNDFAALLPDAPPLAPDENPLFQAVPERGLCRVVCFSPDHSLTVSRMSVEALRLVVDAWVEQFTDLAAKPFVNAVQIFENRGEMMGASNPHPHCQIWATESVPNELAKEVANLESHPHCLLCAYLEEELRRAERIVCTNAHFAALVPFWAVWPFETLVLPRRHVTGVDQLGDEERTALADILRRLTTRYDSLFETPFPYSMGFHQRPTDGRDHANFHMHAHFYPPLLRSATVRKFMVGFEMLGGPQRDLTPETAAARLRALQERHYQDRSS